MMASIKIPPRFDFIENIMKVKAHETTPKLYFTSLTLEAAFVCSIWTPIMQNLSYERDSMIVDLLSCSFSMLG